MAKSIRSKWKRKMRAIKRERYGKKELDRLKKTLGIEETQPGSSSNPQMENISEIVTFTTTEEIKKKKDEEVEDIMDENEVQEINKFNPKTLRNEQGAYPVWVHPRKIKKVPKKKKKTKSKGKVSKKRKTKKFNL